MITVEANELVRPMNDRMPAIVQPEQYQLWLDPDTPVEQLQKMLVPFPAGLLQADEVKEPSRRQSGLFGERPITH